MLWLGAVQPSASAGLRTRRGEPGCQVCTLSQRSATSAVCWQSRRRTTCCSQDRRAGRPLLPCATAPSWVFGGEGWASPAHADALCAARAGLAGPARWRCRAHLCQQIWPIWLALAGLLQGPLFAGARTPHLPRSRRCMMTKCRQRAFEGMIEPPGCAAYGSAGAAGGLQSTASCQPPHSRQDTAEHAWLAPERPCCSLGRGACGDALCPASSWPGSGCNMVLQHTR